jgi:S1-C subfamily serine protease
MRRALALVAALGLLAGCGGGGGGSSTAAKQPTGAAGSTSQTQTQTDGVAAAKSSDVGANGFDPQAIYKSEAPGVVTVIALTDGGEALGSGFVIDSGGYIATNAHVVTSQSSGAKAKQVYVQFGDGNKLSASIVGTDLDADVALLKVDPSALRGPGAKLVPLRFGSTTDIQVGDPVVAIGSPFGEPQSLSVGVVSALNRDIESLTNFPIGNAVQTDAAINHGNSGGPLLERGGKVVGINSQIRSSSGGGEGVGFAIPVETVKRSVDQLRAKGHVDYAYLGISSVPLYPQLAERLGLKVTTGALVDKVVPDGPADKAGLQGAESHITFQGVPQIPVGSDVIVAVGGKKLTQNADLSDLIGLHQPGETVQLTAARGGQERAISVKLGERPERVTGAG